MEPPKADPEIPGTNPRVLVVSPATEIGNDWDWASFHPFLSGWDWGFQVWMRKLPPQVDRRPNRRLQSRCVEGTFEKNTSPGSPCTCATPKTVQLLVFGSVEELSPEFLPNTFALFPPPPLMAPWSPCGLPSCITAFRTASFTDSAVFE